MKTTYLTCAETAKLIRAALKRAFPGVKFGVKSSTYSGGASINIGWVDGPTEGMVKAISGQFSASHFDASIDMKVGHTSWLLADGSAIVASNNGTIGSGGSVNAERNWMPTPDARLVHFGADFVFTNRGMSIGFAKRVVAKAATRYGNLRCTVKPSHIPGEAHIESADWNHQHLVYQFANRFMIVRAGA